MVEFARCPECRSPRTNPGCAVCSAHENYHHTWGSYGSLPLDPRCPLCAAESLQARLQAPWLVARRLGRAIRHFFGG